MAERGLPWAAEHERREYLVRALRERDAIRERLRPERERAAYALAQLEPGLFERTRWFTAEGAGGRALVTHSCGGLGDATFVTGDAEAIAAILAIQPGPARTYLSCAPEYLEAARTVYRLTTSRAMLRMSVTPRDFRPREAVPATRLLGVDIRRINQLYGEEGPPTYYEARHIDAGVYCGVVAGGRLLAIAGTHAVSPQERVAVVGNVFTHPRHRGQGYGTAATSASTQALLEQCDLVTLTVDPSNAPAIASYRRLGYRPCGESVETMATRRDTSALLALPRRLLALYRGRERGGALVSVRL